MADALVKMSAADVATLKAMAAEYRTKRGRGVNRQAGSAPDDDQLWTPEVYVAYVPSAISALAPHTTGTIADDVVTGVACRMFRLNEIDGTLTDINLSRTLYNLTSSAIAADTWALAVRDKFGRWVALPSYQYWTSDYYTYHGYSDFLVPYWSAIVISDFAAHVIKPPTVVVPANTQPLIVAVIQGFQGAWVGAGATSASSNIVATTVKLVEVTSAGVYVADVSEEKQFARRIVIGVATSITAGALNFDYRDTEGNPAGSDPQSQTVFIMRSPLKTHDQYITFRVQRTLSGGVDWDTMTISTAQIAVGPYSSAQPTLPPP